MGSFCSCFGNNSDEGNLMPSPETRRQQQLDAAERRRRDNEMRGIKDPRSVSRQQQRTMELERQEIETARMGGGAPTLKWQAN